MLHAALMLTQRWPLRSCDEEAAGERDRNLIAPWRLLFQISALHASFSAYLCF